MRQWLGKPGGAERSNSHLFFCDLCSLLGVPRPEAAEPGGLGDYVFERAVRARESEGEGVHGWIDLYKRGCFILEAKQSRMTAGGQNDRRGSFRARRTRTHRPSAAVGWARTAGTS